MNCRTIGIAILLVSIIILYLGISGLKSGKVYIEGMRQVARHDSPITYWIHVILYFLVSLLGIFFGLFPELLVQIIKN